MATYTYMGRVCYMLSLLSAEFVWAKFVMYRVCYGPWIKELSFGIPKTDTWHWSLEQFIQNWKRKTYSELSPCPSASPDCVGSRKLNLFFFISFRTNQTLVFSSQNQCSMTKSPWINEKKSSFELLKFQCSEKSIINRKWRTSTCQKMSRLYDTAPVVSRYF